MPNENELVLAAPTKDESPAKSKDEDTTVAKSDKLDKEADKKKLVQAPGFFGWLFGWGVPKSGKENTKDDDNLTDKQAKLKLRTAEVTSYGQFATATADIVTSTNQLAQTYLVTDIEEKKIAQRGREAGLAHEEKMDAQGKTHAEKMRSLALEERRLTEEGRQFDVKYKQKDEKQVSKKSEVELAREQLAFQRERWLFERNNPTRPVLPTPQPAASVSQTDAAQLPVVSVEQLRLQ